MTISIYLFKVMLNILIKRIIFLYKQLYHQLDKKKDKQFIKCIIIYIYLSGAILICIKKIVQKNYIKNKSA